MSNRHEILCVGYPFSHYFYLPVVSTRRSTLVSSAYYFLWQAYAFEKCVTSASPTVANFPTSYRIRIIDKKIRFSVAALENFNAKMPPNSYIHASRYYCYDEYLSACLPIEKKIFHKTLDVEFPGQKTRKKNFSRIPLTPQHSQQVPRIPFH